MRLALSLLAAACLAAGPAEAQSETSPKGYIEMPKSEDGTWVLTSRPGSGRNWGRPVFIRYLVMVAREWRRRHPQGPVLRLGDLSKPDGSNFPPHKTHKDGLTADIFTSPKNICHVRYKDQDLTLELAQLMYDLGARQILYNHPKVTSALAVAKKWPKHDDHFHVVIDPSRVPAEGSLLVLPRADSADGSWIPKRRLEKDATGLRLSWRVLGKARLKGYRVLFDDMDDKNGVLHDSELQRKRRPSYKLPIPIAHGKRYRWRVILVGKDAEHGCGWQTLRVDLEPPTVTAFSPTDNAMHDQAPTLVWRYSKPKVPQADYRIELDNDPSHRRVWRTLGPFKGAATRHALPKKLFRRSKRYHWRVVVHDAHGNEAATPWETFKTSAGYGKKGKGSDPKPQDEKLGTVNAGALNLRGGPGTNHPVKATLRRGDPVAVLGERDGWLEVEARPAGKPPVRGFVSKRFITLN